MNKKQLYIGRSWCITALSGLLLCLLSGCGRSESVTTIQNSTLREASEILWTDTRKADSLLRTPSNSPKGEGVKTPSNSPLKGENSERMGAEMSERMGAELSEETSERMGEGICAELSEGERHILKVKQAHVGLKLRQQIPSDIDLEAEGEWLKTHSMRDIAAEAYYILGAYENWKGDDFQATEHLKQAEALGGSAIIRGMTQYKLGRISESEQLYEVAAHYYENAIPYMETAGLPLYAASAYRELARTVTPSGSGTPSNSRTPSGSPKGEGLDRKYYFERALDWAHQTGDTLLYLDILYAEKTLLGADQNEVIAISKYLCDTAGIVRYAYDLVKYNLKKEDYATAAHYLDVLATDTNALTWSKEKYTFLKSQLLHQEKQDKEAYEQLLSLYNKQSGEIEETGKSRTFAIAQRYDNEAERAKNLQLELEKQRLYMSLAAMIIAVLVVTILLIIYLSRRHARALVEKAEQEQHIESLKNELALRRDSLKKILQERIYLTKNLQESIVRHSEEGEIPEWAKNFVEVNIFTNEEQWGDFRKKFNEAYGNLLSSLKEEHPQLTTSDMQVIALTLIGLDISDICLLLNLTKRTIWSRRQRIKEHVGLGNDESLEDWLSKFGTGFA